MAQIIPFDALLGASKTGLAIGATIYQLDGSTSYAAFSTTGWYEAPAGSGGWHHAGLSLPDAGGVVAVGISATEYLRIAVDAAVATATAIKAKTDNLPAAPASTTNITAGTITTVTNLTNAPTNGDLTATMKTSVTTAASAATPTAAAVTGNVGGNVVGSVGSVVAGVGLADGAITAAKIATDAITAAKLAADVTTEIQSGLATAAALTTVDTVVDGIAVQTTAILDDTGTSGVVVAAASKTGYTLSAAGVQAIWDALTSALTVVGSVGKRIADNLDATITSRMATFTYTTPPTVAAISDGVWDEATAGHTTAGTFGEQLKTDVDAILDDTGTAGVVVAAASKTGYELSATGITAIWANATRTLTSFGTLAADVWAVAVRTITGGSLTVAPPTAAQIDTQLAGTHGAGSWATATGFATPTNVSDAQTAIVAAIPGTTAIVDAIKAYAVETGVTFNDAMRIILAANGGNFLADDPNDPTEIIYYAPDGTTARLTFAVTTTTRTVV